MRLFRRHRGSQTGDLTPNYRIHVVAPDGDPAEMARAFSYALNGKRPPERLTARHVITASLLRDEFLGGEVWDPAWVESLVDRVMLDLGEAGLEIVTREDVE